MSFGWSASDIALLVQLAYKTTQGARAACGQYDILTKEISNLHIILSRLQTEVAKPDNPINRRGASGSYQKELKSIANGCEEVLAQLDKILVKYNALSEQERSVRRLWKKIRFGSGRVADVAELRSRITYYTSALSLFLNLISVGTVGEVERKMDQAGGDLQDIKAAVNHITAHFLANERREGSVLTSYTNDDKNAWRELRRGLVKAGFRGSVVRKHMNTIMAYVKELGDKGVLDDINTSDTDSPPRDGQNEGPVATETYHFFDPPEIHKPAASTHAEADDHVGIKTHSESRLHPRQQEPQASNTMSTFEFWTAEVRRYCSSFSPSATGFIVLDDIDLPTFIADQNIVYRTDIIIPKESIVGLPHSLYRPWTLRDLIHEIMVRLIFLKNLEITNSAFTLSERSERAINRCIESKNISSVIKAMQILLPRRQIFDPKFDMTSIASLDARQDTTLCSMFLSQCIREINDPASNSSFSTICTWFIMFDMNFPGLSEQIEGCYFGWRFLSQGSTQNEQSSKSE
ncbi:MAG: hypothetical protein Q9213_002092 [Squamulea squamosa]